MISGSPSPHCCSAARPGIAAPGVYWRSMDDDSGMSKQSFAAWPLETLLERIGDRAPTPGGGAVASVVGALGAALARMAMNYSIRKSTPDEDRIAIEALLSDLGAWADDYLAMAEADAQAYGELNRLQKLADDDPERVAGWSDALSASIAAPLRVVNVSVAMLRRLDGMVDRCNMWLRSDFAIAAILADAAARAGAWNVRVNLPLLPAGPEADYLRADIERSLREAAALAAAIGGRCAA